MYIANMCFGKFLRGEVVPDDLPYNDERLKNGLIREVKTVAPTEQKDSFKAKINAKRKPKTKTEQ